MILFLLVWLAGTVFVCSVYAASNPYSSVVLFGASYCDNGHTRAEQYQDTLFPPPYYSGRHSNGLVFAEYMARRLGVDLNDYAYPGAMVDNSITAGPVPDTKSQVANYTSQVSAGSLDRGSGRVLHMWWVGINDIIALWNTATLSSSLHLQVLDELSSNVDSLVNQTVSVATSAAVKSQAFDILVLTIPPSETLPLLNHMSNGNHTHLSVASDLSTTYNSMIVQKITRASRQLNMMDTFKAYDIEGFWRDMYYHPSQYDFKNVTGFCYDDLSAGKTRPCKHPDQYMYWDSLHPTTATHKHLSDELMNAIGEGDVGRNDRTSGAKRRYKLLFF